MLELVDTHCHIQSAGVEVGERMTRELWAKGAKTANEMIAAAKAHGVTRMLCVGCDLEDSKLAIDFVQDKPQCWATIGIHPHEAQLYVNQPEKLAEFTALTERPKVVAVGECGFDFYYNHSPQAAQTEILCFQIELALKNNLPIIFHVREAFDAFWTVFDRYEGIRGVLHSFTDSEANLQKAMDRGLHIGINGIATFAKDPKQLEMYKSVPLKKILLETDAPFLTPHPYRGSINEPKQVGTIADFLADLRGESRQLLSEATTTNARALFGV